MTDIRIPNLTNKTLRQFVPGDTIYMQKMKNGFSYTYYCKFIRLDNGVVEAEIIKTDIPYDTTKGIIRARPYQCYLWGMDKWERCHWFRNGLDKPAN